MPQTVAGHVENGHLAITHARLVGYDKPQVGHHKEHLNAGRKVKLKCKQLFIG